MAKQDNFSKEVQKEINNLAFAPSLFEGRERDVGLTIDGPTSKDLDDAIFVERVENGYSVQVLIADVASLVTKDSSIYNEALDRVETQYRSDYNTPMLPRSLSEDRLSLLEGQRRPTITFYIDVSDELEVQKIEIRETFFQNVRRMNYKEVDDIIENNPKDPDYNMLVICNNLAQQLLEKRRKRGALVIYDLKRNVFTNEEGQILPLDSDRANKGNLIVQELMILANQTTAKFFAEQNIPFLFRNHTIKQSTPSRDEIISQFNAAVINPYLIEKLGERVALWFERAVYEPVLKGHFGLNEAAYAHVTSPIRRFPDLINQQIVKAFIKQDETPYSQEDLVKLSTQINEKIVEIRDARAEYFKTKATVKAQYQASNSSIDGLVAMDSNEFRLVLKQVCRSGIIGDDFEHALKTRFDINKVDVSHLYTIFFDMVGSGGVWSRFREWALNFAYANPGYSNQLLNLQTQKGNLSHYEMEIKQAQEGFMARVIAATNAGVFSTEYYAYGQSKKEAQHKASFSFLMGYLEHTLVVPNQTKEPEEFALPSITNAEDNPFQSSTGTNNENYVGQLNELCASKVGWSMPRYQFRQAGPSHQPIISCECILETGQEPVTAGGTGTSKKVAKQTSAQHMLDIIFRDEVVFSPREVTEGVSNVQEENYVGRLNESCQRHGWPLPIYQFDQAGPSHNPDFTCIVTIQPAEGAKEIVGKGTSKKEAKQTAAQICLNTIESA
jgi:ribonuclease R